jgi:hypothetical protein
MKQKVKITDLKNMYSKYNLPSYDLFNVQRFVCEARQNVLIWNVPYQGKMP